MPNSSSFHLSVEPFDGDPQGFEFFSSQVSDLSAVNHWSVEQTALFLKSKLTGSARKFLLASPTLLKSTDPKLILGELKKFFVPVVDETNFLTTEDIKLLPGESLKNFNLRLSQHISLIYKNIIDPKSVEQIKFRMFMDKIPLSIRIQLIKEGVKTYDDALKRGQLLQDLDSSEQVLHLSKQSGELGDIRSQVSMLQEQIAQLTTIKSNASISQQCNFQSSQDIAHNQTGFNNDKVNFSQTYSRRGRGFPSNQNRHQSGRNHNNFNRGKKSKVVCFACRKPGHTVSKCFKLQSFLRHVDNENQGGPSTSSAQNVYTQSTTTPNLNANAPEFNLN